MQCRDNRAAVMAYIIATHCHGYKIRFALKDKDRERSEHSKCWQSSARAEITGNFDPPKPLDDARSEINARIKEILPADQYVAMSWLYTNSGFSSHVGL